MAPARAPRRAARTARSCSSPGAAPIQTAVQAIKEGAYDFIEKPLEIPRLRIVLERALEKKETMREVQLLRRRLAALAPGTDMIGSGPGHAEASSSS